ncbi:hypothetical protein ACLQ2Q_17955 [Microbacterium sp. DT81.1]|uniref:hypothetical protein n=1 Tax=Microbacterium sp. DT81.1 TaxID=3393413 RepID=UPI003CF4EFCE
MVALVALTAAGALAGCAGGSASGSGSAADTKSHAAARTAVADVARGLYREGTDVIEDYARWADTDTQTSGGVELIGFEEYPGAVHGEPFGALQFRATVPPTQAGDPYVACFESEFDFWGVATEKFGDWSNDTAVAHDIPCPPDAARIPPPVDTRPVYVVPDGAEALVVEVFTNASATASADDILAEVVERMPQPSGDREVAFEPRATVAGGDIGFAMGDGDDCLLVKRGADGVQVLHVPRILLQPGELGCSPDTALRPLEQLQSPH